MDPEIRSLIVGVVTPSLATIGIVATALISSRRPARTKPEPDDEEDAAARPPTSAPNAPDEIAVQRARTESDSVTLAAFKEFREWAENRINQQDERIDRLQNALARMSQKYTLLKEAFREFVVATRRRLGNETPPLESHVRELLVEDDLDGTLDIEFVREVRRDPPPPVA